MPNKCFRESVNTRSLSLKIAFKLVKYYNKYNIHKKIGSIFAREVFYQAENQDVPNIFFI